jgi:hypothetical protein
MLETAHLDALECRLERWAARRFSCAPSDRDTAEEGIRLTYRAVDLPPPQRIIWCGGPVEIAKRLAAIGAGDRIGANVRATIIDGGLRRIATFAEIFCKEIVVAASDISNKRPTAKYDLLEQVNGVSAAINRIVDDATREIFSRPSVKIRNAMRWSSGLPRLLPLANFSEIALGPNNFASLGVYEYLYDVASWKDEMECLRGLWAVAKSASWIVPHERVCWIAERPETLRTDAGGRLHSVDGPALRYRDGWWAYAWKGVQTPAWMIEHPERITRSRISKTYEPALRSAMIDIILSRPLLDVRLILARSPQTQSAGSSRQLHRVWAWGRGGRSVGAPSGQTETS